MEELLLEYVKEKWLVKEILDNKKHLENKDITEYIFSTYPLKDKYRYFINKFHKEDFIKVIKYYNNTKAYKKNTINYINITGNLTDLKERYIIILKRLNIHYDLNWHNRNQVFINLYKNNNKTQGYLRYEYLDYRSF